MTSLVEWHPLLQKGQVHNGGYVFPLVTWEILKEPTGPLAKLIVPHLFTSTDHFLLISCDWNNMVIALCQKGILTL